LVIVREPHTEARKDLGSRIGNVRYNLHGLSGAQPPCERVRAPVRQCASVRTRLLGGTELLDTSPATMACAPSRLI